MKVILLETVANVGTVGDVVTVKDGFGRNYLIPKNLATPADAKKVKVIEHQQRMLETKRQRELEKSQGLAQQMEGLVLTFSRRSADEGHLFGSVTPADLEKAFQAEGYDILRKQIQVEQPIRSLGEHEITVRLSAGVKTSVKVVVDKEETSKED